MFLCYIFLKVDLDGKNTFVTCNASNRRFIPISDLCGTLSSSVLQNTLAMHAITGCDSISSFYGIGKTIGFDRLKSITYLLKYT